MGKDTGIEWTDSTWNPWVGCMKVSQGCKNCYMFREQARYGNSPTLVRRTGDETFYAPKRKREFGPLVFTCSWSDFFIEDADDWREDAWGVIRDTPHLTYQILTKRPERIAECLPDDWGDGWANVWLGTSAEDQPTADHRIPSLLMVPAAVHFVSCEPLLERVMLSELDVDAAGILYLNALRNTWGHGYKGEKSGMRSWYKRLDWVIIGGESGPHAREMAPAWAEWIVGECNEAEVPVFVKQLGGWPDKRGGDRAVVFGRTWQQFPNVTPAGQLEMF